MQFLATPVLCRLHGILEDWESTVEKALFYKKINAKICALNSVFFKPIIPQFHFSIIPIGVKRTNSIHKPPALLVVADLQPNFIMQNSKIA